MEKELDTHENKVKRAQVVFKTGGPTYVCDEAPGIPVFKHQNKRYRRVVVAPPAMTDEINAANFRTDLDVGSVALSTEPSKIIHSSTISI